LSSLRKNGEMVLSSSKARVNVNDLGQATKNKKKPLTTSPKPSTRTSREPLIYLSRTT
jgi:hypothetical protein